MIVPGSDSVRREFCLVPSLAGEILRPLEATGVPTNGWRKGSRTRLVDALSGQPDARRSRGVAIARSVQDSTPDLEPRSHGLAFGIVRIVSVEATAFHEGKPARLTSHRPRCSVRVNGAGGGMKGTRLGWALPTDSLAPSASASDDPPPSSARDHAPFPPSRSSDPLKDMAWTRTAGTLWQRPLVSQRAKTGE